MRKVKKVVCLSTDKAAYPINAMGISKAMMEKIVIAESRKVIPNFVLEYGSATGKVEYHPFLDTNKSMAKFHAKQLCTDNSMTYMRVYTVQ